MTILVDPIYNPNFRTDITSSTKLSPHTSIATFLGSYCNRTSFDYVVDKQQRFDIARQLYLHAELMKTVLDNPQFDDFRLVVAESLFEPGSNEVVTPDSINDFKQSGRAVVYQLFNKNGKMDLDATYDLAVYWKDYVRFEQLILDYDNYDPSGILSAQIVVVMPVVDSSFNPSQFTLAVNTNVNGQFQSAALVKYVL